MTVLTFFQKFLVSYQPIISEQLGKMKEINAITENDHHSRKVLPAAAITVMARPMSVPKIIASSLNSEFLPESNNVVILDSATSDNGGEVEGQIGSKKVRSADKKQRTPRTCSRCKQYANMSRTSKECKGAANGRDQCQYFFDTGVAKTPTNA